MSPLAQFGDGTHARTGGHQRGRGEDKSALGEGGGESGDPSQSEPGGGGGEESKVVEQGGQSVHAERAGRRALEAVMKKTAKGQWERGHHGVENEGGSHTGGGADEIAAAGNLAFFAGFLAASRGGLFGLVRFGHSRWWSLMGRAAKLAGELQNPFRGIECAAKTGIKKSWPVSNGAAHQRQAQQVLERDPDKQDG